MGGGGGAGAGVGEKEQGVEEKEKGAEAGAGAEAGEVEQFQDACWEKLTAGAERASENEGPGRFRNVQQC